MPTYPWKRFWAPREGSIDLGDGGFLIDPDGRYGRSVNPDLTTLEQLEDVPCLVLLGEPGIGKSTVIESHFERVKSASQDGRRLFVYRDLRSYSSDYLFTQIFESNGFRAWKEGSGLLDLYLDSLDECSVRINSLAALLIDQLRELPLGRLRLRLGCRTAEWPGLLESELKARFGIDGMKVVELVPLRRADVVIAAEINHLPVESFLSQVWQAAAVPLAIKPITLDFLIKVRQERGALPSTQADLYEKGCLILCEERSPSRIAAGHVGQLSAAQRMDVASWIAAAMIFGGKSAIRTAPVTGSSASDELTLFELEAREFGGEQAIRDVLKVSGLFSARGADRLGWAHKTYSEFLAARFLARQKVPLHQIRDLIFHHHDPDAVVPQLREAASWVASLRSDVFADIGKRDPQVLLASDVVKADEGGRRDLVQRLLEAFDSERALDDDWDERVHYRKLKHSGLGKQLRRFVVDRSKNIIVRRVAIDIAERCYCHELLEDLLAVALDGRDDAHSRQQAAHAVAVIGDAGAHARLRPLLAAGEQEDPHDELRGIALSVLYPEHMSAEELFDLLRPQRDEIMIGTYSDFISERAYSLTSSELPAALRWATAPSGPQQHDDNQLNTLHDSILRVSWAHFEDKTVLPRLVDLVERRLKGHDNPFGRRQDQQNIERPLAVARRAVSHELFLRIQPADVTSLTHGTGQLLDGDDFDWLLDEFEKTARDSTAATVAKLVAALTWGERDADRLSRVISLAQTHPVLAAEMRELLQPVELGSEKAEQMRETHRLMMDRHEHRELNGIADPVERVLDAVEDCERDIDLWWKLTLDLSLKPGDRPYQITYRYRLSLYPGWAAATPETRERIVALSRRYVIEGDPANDVWFGTGEIRNSALAGYRALQLVFESDPAWLQALGPSALQKWVPIVASYPSDPNEQITRLIGEKCGADLLAAVVQRIDHQATDNVVDAHELLDSSWTDGVASAFLEKARVTSSARVQNALIAQGLKHGDARFARFGEEILRTPLPESPSVSQTEQRLALWVAFLRRALASSWSTLWELMRRDAALARDAFLQLGTRLHRDAGELLQPLTPEQLADLYLWLATQFPPEPSKRRSGWMSPGDSVADFRDAVLEHLKHRADWNTLPALDRIADALPTVPHIRLHRIQARRAAAQGTWQPVAPAHLAVLVADSVKRVVESASQLSTIVVESLERFQSGLHDELSGIRDIWNESPTGWHPKEEAALANRVARHLRDELETRGVIVNREVKIRWGVPGVKGQQTDIYIDAFAPRKGGQIDHLAVVVEVKGCWNKEVLTAMAEQLVQRYLRDNNSCDHGIYLVGWFIDDGWDTNDSRNADSRRLLPDGLDASRALFDEQARTLSRDGKSIKGFVLDARLHRQ